MSSTTTTETFPLSSTTLHPTKNSPTYGKINYVPANHTPTPSPHNFHLPSISSFNDSRTLPLHDLRPLPTLSQLPDTQGHASLSTHNFTALRHPSTLHSTPYSYASWKDPGLLKDIYVPETEEMVRKATGARRVITEALLLRSVLWTEEDALATHAGHGINSSASLAEQQQHQEQQQQQQPQKQQHENKEEITKVEPDSNPSSLTSSSSFPQFIGFDISSGGASPAPKVHQDYTPAGARIHLQNYHPALTAAAIAADLIPATKDTIDSLSPCPPSSSSSSPPPRWALYSIWRPLKPVSRDPLALCDARTVGDDEYVPIMVRTPTLGGVGGVGGDGGGLGDASGAGAGKGETHDCEAWLARAAARGRSLERRGEGEGEEEEEGGGGGGGGGAAGHEWYWVSNQKPDEVLVIGLFDSAREGTGKGAGGAMHSSVELVGARGEEEARESLELRCLAIW